jgi:hypothetical protein
VSSIVNPGCLLVVLLDNDLSAPWIRPDLPDALDGSAAAVRPL